MIDTSLLESSDDDEVLEFTQSQIEYLRNEFERQRRWVNTLSLREKSALDEIEQMTNSVSYRLGRIITWPLRRVEKLFRKGKIKFVHFVEESKKGVKQLNCFLLAY